MDVSALENNINKYLNKNKFFKSNINFGLVTVRFNDFKPKYLFKEEIPKDKLNDYLIASCFLPIFKFEKMIDDSYYLDGGFYNNVPLSLVEHYGCDTIYSIRIKGIGFSHNKLKKDTKVIEIKPKVNLGSIILFDHESNKNNLILGYLDALKVINKCDGFCS